METSKVFVVFYKDYHKMFEGIFSTREKAEKYIEYTIKHSEYPETKDSYTIDEIEIDYLEMEE